MLDARVQRADVDGVPVFWAEKPEPGPLQASLMFRVGKIDETLPTNDITHLLEHIVLHGVDRSGDEIHRNGHVATGMTSFDIVGEPSEVVRFLGGVCAGLVEPPVQHLDHESRVLEAEAARSSANAATHLMFRRFGPSGPGLWWCQEFGRINADAETVRAWSHERFTTGAAALFLTGPVPEGLRLELPAGDRIPAPPLDDNMYAAPLWVEHQFPDVVAHTVVPRSAPAVAWATILQTRLVARLRAELGIAYSPSVVYDPHDADLAMVSVAADAHPEHLAEAATVLYEELEALATDGPTSDQLETYRAPALRQLDVELPAAAAAFRAAFDHVMGGRDLDVDRIRSDIEALTTDSIREAAQTARTRLLYGVPEDVSLPDDIARPMPSWSLHPPIEGSWYRPATREPIVISTSPLGTSMRGQGDDYVAVPYASCRGVLAWPDGRRVLVSDEGLTLTVEPNLWIGGHGLVRLIDQQTAGVRIPMPARAPEEIPRIADPQPDTAKAIREARDGLLVSVAVFLLAAVSLASQAGSPGIAVVACVVFGVGAVVFGLGLLRQRAAARRAAQADGAGGHSGTAYPS